MNMTKDSRERATTADAGADSAPARRDRRRKVHSTRRLTVIISAVIALIAGGVIWAVIALGGSGKATAEYDIQGMTFTSNVMIADEPSGIYLYLPVNSDMTEVVVEAEDPRVTEALRAQLEQIDTFIPGEHVLELDQLTIHVIVDGIEE